MKLFNLFRLILTLPILVCTLDMLAQCDPPSAMCQDVTITLDANGEYSLDVTEVDAGCIAPCGLQSISLDQSTFTCDDVDPVLQPAALFELESNAAIIQNAGELAVDGSGNVYVTDINNEVILKFDGNGNFVQQIGSSGFGVGQFANLRGLALDQSGNIYGTDDNRDKVLVFNSSGVFQNEFGVSGSGTGQFTNPWRISVSTSGIYVVDNVLDKVVVFDGFGNFLFEFGSFGTNPGNFDNPANIAHDASGLVYILDQHRRKVIKFDAAGNFISEWGQAPSAGVFEGRLDIVEGLAIGNNGNVYVADRSSSLQNNKIKVFDNDGNFIYEFGNSGATTGKFGWAYAVAVDQNDNIYVSDLSRDLYLKFDQVMAGNLVTLTITDINGLEACCTAEVTVLEGAGCIIDDIPPTIASCGGGGYFLPLGACSGPIFYNVPTFDDNSLSAPVEGTLVSGPAPGDNFPSGPTTVVYEYYDPSGNGPAICSFEVIGLPQCEDITVTLNNGSASVTPDDFFPQPCPDVGYDIFLGQTSYDCYDVGQSFEVRTLITHDNGQHTCYANVTVVDDGSCNDQDGDGYTIADGDCDDQDPSVNPGAPEICDGLDNNCDGVIDEDLGIYSGNLVITSQAQLDALPIYTIINGNLNIIGTDVSDLSNLNCLVEIKNGLHIYDNPNLQSLTGLENLSKSKGVTIRRNHALINLDGLSGLAELGQDGIEVLDNDGLIDISLPALIDIGYSTPFNAVLWINDNTNLQSISFPSITYIQGRVGILLNPNVTQISFPVLTEIGDQFQLWNSALTQFTGFPSLQTIGLDLSLVSNTLMQDFGDLAHVNVGNSIFINGGAFTSLDGLSNNTVINDQLRITGLNQLTEISRLSSITSIATIFELKGCSQLSDCCPIAPLLTGGNVGTIIIENNGNLCSSEQEIISTCIDQDGDGYTGSEGDCDDMNASIFPGATELCDGVDNNCDGQIDEDLGTWSGNLIISSQADLDAFGSYTEVTGNLNIIGTDVHDLTPLSCLRKTKQLVITSNPNLTSLNGLQNLEEITGSLRIIDNQGLTEITELTNLWSVGFNMGISDNSQVEIIQFPALTYAGNFIFSIEISNHPVLHTVSFPVLESTNEDLNIQQSPLITNFDFPVLHTAESILLNQLGMSMINGFTSLTTIANGLNVNTCQNLQSLDAFDNVDLHGGIFLQGCSSLNSLGTLGNGTMLNYLTIRTCNALQSLEGMEDITMINGNLTVQFNANLSNCCAIAELLDASGVTGTVTISNNPQFCGSKTEIISYCLDNDGDGYTTGDGDCDDNNPAINPGQPEVCNGFDDDCDGLVDLEDDNLVDNTPPSFIGSLPIDITVDCNLIPVPATVEFTDECSAELIFSQTSNWDGVCSQYTITRTWTVEDIGGNTAYHIQHITVQDQQAPQFTSVLPEDITADAGDVPLPENMMATDNCSPGTVIFMEMDPISASNESLTLTGTLGSTQVTWSLEGVSTNEFKFRDVYTDNSLTTFSNASYFTPALAGLDGAGFNAISGSATLRITFDQPVQNPVLHINNIDISRWDFSATTTNLSLISGNNQIQLENAIVVDPDPTTSGGLNSGLGSLMFHGSYSEIVGTITLVDVTTDGLFLQLSKSGDQVVTFSETTVPGQCPGDELITRTWTATDGCGLSNSHVQMITVEGPDPGPQIESLTIPADPIQLGNAATVSGEYTDVCDLDDHLATWDWGDGTSSTGLIDHSTNTVTGNHVYASSGVYQVTLSVEDSDGNIASLIGATYIVLYDPSGGFVTGGGWIQSPTGAYVADPQVTGKANFGFVSKYQNGANTPTGNTQFKFNAASFKFRSTSYEWLVVAGPNAKFKGEGTVNNQGNYGFMLTGVDGQINGGGGTDQFRIKIWDKDLNDQVVYDNKLGSDDTGYDSQELGGGSITIHQNPGGGNNLKVDHSNGMIQTGSMLVYPNPSKGIVQVQLSDEVWKDDSTSWYVSDLHGRRIYQSQSRHISTWDGSGYPKGIYFITVVNSMQKITQKIILTD